MVTTLSQCTIALAEGRQLDELAAMVEKEGAAAVRCPMVSMLDAPDAEPVMAWLHKAVDVDFDYVIFFTGEGVRRLMGFAEREGIRDAVVNGLAQAKIVTRGPKPVRALQEISLSPALTATKPTTEGVIDTLRGENLQGKTVGVQMYSDANPPLTEFLRDAGATVYTTLPYVYAPAADADRVANLIARLANGDIHVVIFTSSPQVSRLFEVAKERGTESDLLAGFQKSRVAAVGPVVADQLREFGVTVDICPEQGFVMKNLVNQIKRALENE